MKFVAIIMVLGGVAAFTARAGAKDADSPLSVYVVNYPLQYFAERIGGPDVRVVFPAPADGDPAFWKPLPEQIAAYQKPDLTLYSTDQFKYQEISEDIMNFIAKVSPTFYYQNLFEVFFVRSITFNV